MVDKDYLAFVLEDEEYVDLVDKYGTKDLSLIAELIIKEGTIRD